MSLLLMLSLVAQAATGLSTLPSITIDKPTISVSAQGKALISVKSTEYKIVLYADISAETENKAREQAELMREAIKAVVREMGGQEKDVVLINLNTLQPIEEDPYYRVEQDIQVWLKNVDDINIAKEKFMLTGIQIGSITPLINEVSDYTPAIEKARSDAVKNAQEEANALANAAGVKLGEPIYITESILYPTYTGYETSGESVITVTVIIFYNMIYRK
ncbi:MAG: SIMPL domain-containing protein [candidate division WOR-3 bacterium]|nr:MAG: SIMPL domain-containing protein [candidate division WOR-3 bacterium]